jgi:hypothetical protein
VVVKGVEIDIELVGLDNLIPPSQRRLDQPRLPVMETGADVQCVVTDEHPDLGALGGRLPLRWVSLGKARHRLGRSPGGLVQPAVHRYGALSSAGPDLGRRGMPTESRGLGSWSLVLKGCHEGECESGG